MSQLSLFSHLMSQVSQTAASSTDYTPNFIVIKKDHWGSIQTQNMKHEIENKMPMNVWMNN
jgi:hypothetical protein